MSYRDAMEELIGLTEAKVIPPEVVRALASIFDHPNKLFCCELESGTASGVSALSSGPRLQASNLLVKLVLAARALDWEVIIVASEQHGGTPQLGATLADQVGSSKYNMPTVNEEAAGAAANAAIIVRAVNAHEDLVKAARLALEFWNHSDDTEAARDARRFIENALMKGA